MRLGTLYHLLIVTTCLLASSGCATLQHAVPRHAVPEDLVGKALVVGMPDIRTYVDKPASRHDARPPESSDGGRMRRDSRCDVVRAR